MSNNIKYWKGEDELTADLSAVYQIEWEVAADGEACIEIDRIFDRRGHHEERGAIWLVEPVEVLRDHHVTGLGSLHVVRHGAPLSVGCGQLVTHPRRGTPHRGRSPRGRTWANATRSSARPSRPSLRT